MQKMKISAILALLFTIPVLASACVPVPKAQTSTQPISPPNQIVTETTLDGLAEPTPTDGLEAATSEVLPMTPAAANTDPAVVPTETLAVKTELEATNPAGVVLASGELQLVEFFAFW